MVAEAYAPAGTPWAVEAPPPGPTRPSTPSIGSSSPPPAQSSTVCWVAVQAYWSQSDTVSAPKPAHTSRVSRGDAA